VGFTLIELLVVIAMIAIIAAVLFRPSQFRHRTDRAGWYLKSMARVTPFQG
jgi:prepilin-type N-terminal cleavage/methylation domain-containing protein